MNKRSASGMSLVEVVVAVTILGIASSTIFALLSHIAMRGAEVMLAQQAGNIAAAYLQEITGKSFGTGVGCGAPPRPAFTQVCDYNGLDELGARDSTNTPITGLGLYRVQVAVDLTALGAVPARLIVVTVTDPSGQQTNVSSFKVAP